MSGSARQAFVITTLLLAPALREGRAQAADDVRRPRGIYALFLVGLEIQGQQTRNPSITDAELHTYLRSNYNTALANPAVSGLVLEVGWRVLNPSPPSSPQPYDWSWLDDGFSSVSAWNALNPANPPKTIQVGLGAGFTTPQWVMDQIPSCDGLFMSPPQTPPSNCGKATFLGFSEGGGGVLPLPWNSTYKSAFKTFLTAFAAQYGTNPALVSMDVAGPSAASTETILPINANTPAQAQFGGIQPDEMWRKLFALAYPGQAAYQNSDQAFIDEWNAAIDLYGQTFQGLTLLLWAEPGLASFSPNGFTVASVPSALKQDCPVVNMNCAAITQILSHFADPSVGGTNAKATSTAALTALSGTVPTDDLSINAVRLLAQSTAQLSSPSAQILGGQQADQAIVSRPVHEGCTAMFPPAPAQRPPACTVPSTCSGRTPQTCPVACLPQACLAPGVSPADVASFTIFGNIPVKDLISPEQALYNVLKAYFSGTPAASSFGGTNGTAPLNYLQLYWNDIQYANTHVNTPAMIVEAGGATASMSFQDLLNLASRQLLAISEPAPVITIVANAEGENPTIAPNTWVEIKGSNLATVGFDRIWGGTDFFNGTMPTALNGVSVTVNGKSAYVYYVSPSQVNILTPPDAMSSSVQVQVATNGQTAGFAAQAQGLSPSFFVFNGGPYVAAIHGNGTYIGPTSLYPGLTTPAQPGETIVLYANGFGPTSTPVVSGSMMQSGSLPAPPVITIGGIAARVVFAGLVAPGQFQFNVVVPPALANGDQPVTAAYGGVAAQPGALITIHN